MALKQVPTWMTSTAGSNVVAGAIGRRVYPNYLIARLQRVRSLQPIARGSSRTNNLHSRREPSRVGRSAATGRSEVPRRPYVFARR